MPIDTDRLVTIANELKNLEQRHGGLLAELGRIAHGMDGGISVAPRRERRPSSVAHGTLAVVGPRPRGRPPGSRNRPKAAVHTVGLKRRRGITTDIVEFLQRGGGAYTAGEVLAGLKLPPSKSKMTTISTTLFRLVKEGRAKKDKERGYRAA